jgi:FAD:protein FMN transferase
LTPRQLFRSAATGIGLLASAPAAEPVRHEATRLSMGTLYAIEAYGTDAGALPRILDAALDEVDRIDRLMSHYKHDSALSAINRQAAQRPVSVDTELLGFIADALGYASESDGAFDITVGPLMRAWGFFDGGGRVPGDAELAEARRRVGFRLVDLDESRGTIHFRRAGVELDLGGIAKGYAVDRVAAMLRRSGIIAGLISAGGSTVYGLAAPPGRDAWHVDIQDPTSGRQVAMSVALRDRALSVAGISEKWFEAGGSRYSHIMDPRTGRPAQGVLTVVVLADNGTEGDALDNVLFVLGPQKSAAYLRRHPGAEGFFFLPVSRNSWRKVHVGSSRQGR